jgi:flagellar biosynthetic protein FliR
MDRRLVMDGFWWTVLLGARLLPPVMLVPALGGKALVTPAKVGLAALLAAALAPSLAPATAPPEGWSLGLAAAQQAAAGMVLAFAGRCVFLALEMGGRLVDETSGAERLRLGDLFSGEQSSPFMQIKVLLGVLLFYSLGGPEKFLQAFIESLRLFPLCGTPTEAALPVTSLLGMFSAALESGLALALPALAATLGLELVLGAAGRFIPQLPVHFISMPMKYALAIVASAVFILEVLPGRLLF